MTMPLKPSRFNFFYPTGVRGAVLFNSRTGAAVAADGETAQAIAFLLSDTLHEPSPGTNTGQVRDMLISEEFLVSSDRDELNEVCQRRRTRQGSSGGLSLTVAVTLACNFRCIYCYEDHPLQDMTAGTAEALLHFVSSRLAQGTALHVTWFGGEPLLNIGIIEKLSTSFKRLCEEQACSYETFMVTNGHRLTRSIARRLASLGIGDYQITLDGERDVHDRQRPLAGGQGTFDVIIRNLTEVAGDVSSITVRINLLRDNLDSAALLVQRLRAMQETAPALSISLGRIDRSSEHCGTDEARLLSNREFVHCQNLLLGGCTDDKGEDGTALPSPFDTVCCADKGNAFVIGPGGDIFKCWNSLGRAGEAIGHVARECDADTNRWMEFRPGDDAECRECKFLPICQGGCADVQLRTGGAEKNCSSLRYTIRERLVDWAAEQGKADWGNAAPVNPEVVRAG
jgi:uncharacterized protein